MFDLWKRVTVLSFVFSSLCVALDDSSAATVDNKRTTWQPEIDRITCCNGGVPIAPDGMVKNFTATPSDYTIEERTADDVTMNCRDFEVRFLARRMTLLSDADAEFDVDIPIHCKCADSTPRHTLDANCRRLPNCRNNGFRSPTTPHPCICPQPFFGDRCEKYCDQGQRLKGHNGRDYCSCVPFYTGDECRDMLCLNGGREDGGRCICAPQFLGYHCEINTNHTGAGGSRFQRFGDQNNEMFTRDISGTIFSLIMIVVLVVSMYLLMKHRMQTRYLNRRPDLLGACNFPVPAAIAVSTGGPGGTTTGCLTAGRRADMISPDDPRLYSFRPVIPPDSGPPPYFQNRGRRGRGDPLPPLPSYEDATKLPPLRHNVPAAEGEEEENQTVTETATSSSPNGERAEEERVETASVGSSSSNSTATSTRSDKTPT